MIVRPFLEKENRENTKDNQLSRIEKTIFGICAFSRELSRLIAFYSVSPTTLCQNFQTNVKQYKSKCKLRSQSNKQETIQMFNLKLGIWRLQSAIVDGV